MDPFGKQPMDLNGNRIDQQQEAKHHGGSFRNYMQYKNEKLHEQFEANVAAAKQDDLFNGIGIYVNGFTIPSHAELKRLMALHGGRFENYYSRSTVTYIICSNLPDAKVKQFERERSPIPVVTPNWITESIAAGKLLPISNFVLWQLRGGPGQRTLFDTLAAQPTTAAATLSPPQPAVDHPQQPDEVEADAGQLETIKRGIYEHQSPLQQQQHHYDLAELLAAQEIASKMRSECDVLKGGPRSSKDDPNFVESYYRASRLHFIGRWKARLEALMASPAASNAPNPAPFSLGGKRSILHLDMDCFFASVAEAGHPEFKNKPLAVCHSNSARGSGEVSSANYEARRYGIHASMFIARAKELCPELIVVPYEFEKYEKVSEQVYRILLRYTSAVQPISCDEAFLDITGLGDPGTIARSIRNDIFAATGCTASAGIGPNLLLARIATKEAKPNGQFTLAAGQALPFLAELKVGDLPGVGWSTERKLGDLGIKTVAELHASSKSKLQFEMGNNAGAVLWDFAHGRDSRRVEPPKPRQSVGAEVNWGIRFQKPEDPLDFLEQLGMEVEGRMKAAGVRGRTITLKLKRKKPGWQEPVKFLGCGHCDNLSRSVTLASATAAAEDLSREAAVLLRALKVPFDEIRGIGITVTKLDKTAYETAANGAVGLDGASGSGSAEGRVSPRQGSKEHPHMGSQPTGAPVATAAQGSEGSSAGWEVEASASPVGGGGGPSVSPSPASRGQKRKSPGGGSGGKHQTSLLEMMPPPPPRSRHSMDDAAMFDEGDDEIPLRPLSSGGRSARRELLAKYEGMSLTQIDAEELAALPWQVQRELIEMLPRSRQAAAVLGEEVGNEQQGQEAVQRDVGSSADEREQQSAPPSDLPSDRLNEELFSRNNGSEKVGEALPALSQIDQSFLDALPLALRHEIESAYGIRACGRKTGGGGPSAFSTSRGGHRSSRHTSAKYSFPPTKTCRIDAFVVHQDGSRPLPHRGGTSTSNSLRTAIDRSNNITLSQIDPGVLHELPREVQDEILRQVQPFDRRKGAVRQAVAEKAAAAEVTRHRQNLNKMQAAQVEGSLSDNEDEANFQEHLHNVRSAEFPKEVLQLMTMAVSKDQGVDMEALLAAVAAAVHAAQRVQSSTKNIKTRTQPGEEDEAVVGGDGQAKETIEAVAAAVLRVGKWSVAGDLEAARRLMLRVKALGEENRCFQCHAEESIRKLQRRVERRYGWPLALRSAFNC